MRRMLGMCDLKPQDLQGLSQESVTALAAQMSLLQTAGFQARWLLAE